MSKEIKPRKEATPYWNESVDTYFKFCKKKFDEEPSFDGSSPRDLKLIVLALKKRADDAKVNWTESEATGRLEKFLEFAYSDSWLKQNFILSNLNRQKDKIFFNIKQTSNGKTYLGTAQHKPTATINPKGSFGDL